MSRDDKRKPSERSRDELAEIGEILVRLGLDHPGGWICRNSTTGRGMRLHQTTSTEYGRTYDTPEEALRAWDEIPF